MAARATAVIIDGLITFIGLGTLVAVLAGQTHSGNGGVGFNLHGWAALIWLVLAFSYWIACERLWGTTITKRLFSITVESRGGDWPNLSRSRIKEPDRWGPIQERPDKLPGLLGCPTPIRVGAETGEMNAAAAEVDEEEHVRW